MEFEWHPVAQFSASEASSNENRTTKWLEKMPMMPTKQLTRIPGSRKWLTTSAPVVACNPGDILQNVLEKYIADGARYRLSSQDSRRSDNRALYSLPVEFCERTLFKIPV